MNNQNNEMFENHKAEANGTNAMQNPNNIKEGKEEVFLRIYDVTQGLAKVLSPQVLGFQIDGVWHTSIEAFGKEYYFQNRLCAQKAGTTPFGRCNERVSMGMTDCSEEELVEFFEASKSMWVPENYHIIENNCNNFTDWLAQFLVNKGIPSHILELPRKLKDTEFFKNMMKSQF